MEMLTTVGFFIGLLVISGVIGMAALRTFGRMVGIRCALNNLDPDQLLQVPARRQRFELCGNGLAMFAWLLSMGGGSAYWFTLDWLCWTSLAGIALFLLFLFVSVEAQFR